MRGRQSRTKKIIRQLKASDTPAETVWKLLRRAVLRTSKEQGWRMSETAATLGARWRELVEVYGAKATAHILPGGER